MSLSNHQLYEDFEDYRATVVERVNKLTSNLYAQIREGLDELLYDMYFRDVPATEATKQIESILTHLGQYFK